MAASTPFQRVMELQPQGEPHLVLRPIESLGGVVPEVGSVLVGADGQSTTEPTLVTEVFVSPENDFDPSSVSWRRLT